MGCVNRSSSEFKALAASNNVDINTLELITHKYWIETGSEDKFPTNIYIQAQLGNIPYLEHGKNVRALWEKSYSSPLEFRTKGAMMAARNDAARFFPESALVYYKNARGNYVLSVRPPVESLYHKSDDFFEQNFVKAKHLDLGLKEGQAYAIDTVKELFDKFNTDKTSRVLADKVFNIAKKLGLKIYFDESLPFSTTGRYTNDGTIVYKKSFLERDLMNDKKANVLLHEVLHSLSMYVLSNKTKDQVKPKALEKFRTEMNEIFQEVQGKSLLEGQRGITDIFEFVAELSNPIFRSKLQKLSSKTNAEKTLWNRIVDAFRSLLGIPAASDYYSRAMKSLDNALNAFDLDLFMRYNGIRDLLRQGYQENEWQFRYLTDDEMRTAVREYYAQNLPYTSELTEETKARRAQAQEVADRERNDFTYATENDDTGEMQLQTVQSRMGNYFRMFGDLIKTIKRTNNRRGGMSFSVVLKTPAELLVEQNSLSQQHLDMINNMSHDDLLSTFALIDQESADCKMLIEEETKERDIVPEQQKPLTAVQKLKPQYRGKLIYAQSGTGKSTIADNVTVFDSDYLLGQVLGVSPETAGFFFKQLSAQQKKVFGEEYRALIRRKVAEGKTVLTANNSMLNDADVVVYNQSAEQTNERVNRSNRAITNQYSALDYQKETLEQIKQLRTNETNKEYIELNNEEYLSNHLLSDDAAALSDVSNPTAQDRRNNMGSLERGVGSRLTLDNVVSSFLEEFDFTVNQLDEYENDLPLFDALNRVINARSAEDITAGMGYAIAFMMQGDPEMQRIITQYHGRPGDYSTRVKIPFVKKPLDMKNASQALPEKQAIIRRTGQSIARLLKEHFGEDPSTIKIKPEERGLWNLIKRFFQRIGTELFTWSGSPKDFGIAAYKRRNAAKRQQKLFVSDIVDALSRADFSRIKGPRIKPGTLEMAQQVEAEQAFIDNPFEAGIIEKLSNNGIALAGSTSIALEGELYRPAENPLHDIDFATPDNTTKENLDELLPKIFGKDRVAFVNVISKTGIVQKLTGNKEKGNSTATYVTFDRPFTVKTIDRNTQEYYDLDGNYIGKRYLDGGAQLDVAEGVQGKLLDFFLGPDTESQFGFYPKNIGGKNYLISSSKGAMAAKILWARPKDMWDYKHFRGNQNEGPSITEQEAYHLKTMGIDVEFEDTMGEALKKYEDYAQQDVEQQKEMAEIKAKAIADGTFMKAPNGKPTNLNERQWLQVRTKAFKKWFGDWLLSMDSFMPKRNWSIGHIIDNPTDAANICDNTQIKVLNYIRGIAANPSKGKLNAKPVTIWAKSPINDSQIHHSTVAVRINDKVYLYDMPQSEYIKQTDFNKGEVISEYTPRLIEYTEENLRKYYGTSEENLHLQDEVILDDNLENISFNASKVVDENGEPLVVYRGVRDDSEVHRTGTFRSEVKFTTNKKVGASRYGIPIALFINIKNPAIIDYHGEEYDKRIEDEFYVPGNGFNSLDRKTKKAVELGYDGLITKNVKDGTNYPIDDYSFLDMNQAKSATDNNGEFSRENDDIQTFTTPQGEVYGFVTPEGKMLLDRRVIDGSHPIHEYTHLWDRAVIQNNKALWNRGVKLMNQLDLWNEILNDDNYGKKWQEKGIEGEQLTNLIASEVHSRLTGEHGKELLEQIAQQKGKKGIINKLKRWLLAVWKEVGKTFGTWTTEELDKLSLEDFLNMTLRDFVNGINPNLVSKQEGETQFAIGNSKNQRQPFKFKDGTVVNAPFKPNNQQANALNVMADFLKSNATSMTLAGYAGTGKTSLMEMLAQKANVSHQPIIFCATTHKAAQVLSGKLRKAGHEAITMNKALGINVEEDINGEYDARRLVDAINDKIEFIPGTTYVIDEASMIKEAHYDIIKRIAEDNNLKIIFVGDKAQLAPVNEDRVSKVFRNGDGQVVELTQVERTDDNAILKEATAVRNGEALSGKSSFNEEGKGVAYVKNGNKASIKSIVSEFIPGLKVDPDHFRILAYTNNMVAKYNTAVRNLLGYDSTPQKGEPLMGYDNWGYNWRTKTYDFINSGSYKIIKTKAPEIRTITLLDGRKVQMTAIPITIEDAEGNQQVVDYMDVKNNAENRKSALLLAQEKEQLWNMAKRSRGKAAAELYAAKSAIEKFLFVNDDIKTVDGKRTLHRKVVDYGYALTVHKSQGSTFTHVLMDDVDISKANKSQSIYDMMASAEDIFTADHAFNDVSDAVMQGEGEDIDIPGLDFDEAPKASAQPVNTQQAAEEAANIQRQLRYVAMTRATNTVTVISDNVKSEDTPVKHIKASNFPVSQTQSTADNVKTISEECYSKQEVYERIKDLTEYSGIRKEDIKVEYVPETDNESAYWTLTYIINVRPLFPESSVQQTPQPTQQQGPKFTKVNKALSQPTMSPEAQATLNSFMSAIESLAGYFIDNEKNISEDFPSLPNYLVDKLEDHFEGGEALSLDDYRELWGYVEMMPNNGEDRGTLPFIARPKQRDVVRESRTYKDEVFFTETAANEYVQDLVQDGVDRNSIKVQYSPENEKESRHWTVSVVPETIDNLPEGVISTADENESHNNEEEWPSSDPKSQEMTLQNYNLFKDANLDTAVTVDAPWKLPLLQELNDKLEDTTNMTGDEVMTIVNTMDRILSAESEQSFYSPAVKDEKDTQQTLDEYEKLIGQINNLLDSDAITATEVRHIAELVINSISDNITALQEKPELAQEWFPTFSSDLDFKTATRKQIVEAIGIDRFIQKAKDNFDPETATFDYEDLETMDQADLIVDNWNAIMVLAADIFTMNEGFSISRDYSKGKFEVTDAANFDIGYDNYNDFQDSESIKETEGDEQEHWQVESRTIDVLNSMSAMVRQALRECYMMNPDGSKAMSKWGIAERINPRKAVNSILRWTQQSLSLKDMIDRLRTKEGSNPWLSQLIKKLEDKTGKYSDLQSQFYGVFCKDFQLYSVVLLEDGKYHSMPVNSHPALQEAMQSLTTRFKIGQMPLFMTSGINAKMLGSDKTTGREEPFNLHQALTTLQLISQRLNHNEELTGEMIEEAVDAIQNTLVNAFGYSVTEEMVNDAITKEALLSMTKALGFIVNDLDRALKKENETKANRENWEYDPFKYKGDFNIANALRNFLTPITEQLEDVAVSAFYDSGKMYQSYVTPSFTTRLIQKFRQSGKSFEEFLMEEYGNSEWFKDPKQWRFEEGWRNRMIHLLATDEKSREIFDHKVELNFNKHNYMRNMNDTEYTLSLFTEYWAETDNEKESMVPAWYKMSMESNKPSSEFIKFWSYRGSNYKDTIVEQMWQMAMQEISRIQTVKMRNRNENHPDFIANFDTKGRKFNFLPFLNPYMENTKEAKERRNLVIDKETGRISSKDNERLATLLQKITEGKTELTAQESSDLNSLLQNAIRNHTEKRANEILDNWEKSGILEASQKVRGVGSTREEARASLENFLWNDALMQKNILQLTIGDIAFYKDAEDLQKRLAQLHAPGVRGNIEARDYEGNRVSDGVYRTIILKDFDSFVSNIIANISEVFDRKIAAAPEEQKAGLRALKDSLVRPRTYNEDGTVKDRGGKYWNINVADAQGYSSPSSYRKKAFIFGKWSRQAEEVYKKLKRGEYNLTDLETAFQPLKPFVYSRMHKEIGAGESPIQTMSVPFQAKNAEYLLVMADALLQGEETSRPNLLRAVYRIMEESEEINPTQGIDTVQFESAIKSGKQGVMDISTFFDKEAGEELAYTFLKNQIYKNTTDAGGNRTYRDYDTRSIVHETSYDNYCLQQEVPKHFEGHDQAHGSQIRMITPADLDFVKDPNKSAEDLDNQVWYEWKDPDGTQRRVRADEFRREYEETIAANINQSLADLKAELHLNGGSKKDQNIALSKILQREIISSPRYGIDLLQACSVDKTTGEFRIPKGDPIQAKRIEQIVNSIIKNRVNKQKIAGGPIVQVSNFGTSKQLHIRFKHKNGGLLFTEEEYKGWEAATHQTYKEYVKENQAGIAYFEVFAPAWDKRWFDQFANEDGTIDLAALEAVDPELTKMISYRIPTEDKYSCAPIKIVGFMPKEAGEAIMLPYELTEIDDSDFDVDKRYVMCKDIEIKTRRRKEISKLLENEMLKSLRNYKEKNPEGYKRFREKVNTTDKEYVRNQVAMFLDDPSKMRFIDNTTKTLWKLYKKYAYYTESPTSKRTQRNNKIVDMTWAVLTNEMTADKILNPGGFDVAKRMGYMVSAFKNTQKSWEELQQLPTDELKKLSTTQKDLTWVDTQIQFYHQNNAGSSLIGVFAVNKVAHATLGGDGIYMAITDQDGINGVCGTDPFTIAGFRFGGMMEIDKIYDDNGNLIGKVLGSLVSASADTAKEPVLDLMNVNMTTASILNTLIRMGMPFENASLFLSQNIIRRALDSHARKSLTTYESIDKTIDGWLDNFRQKYNITDESPINTEELTQEELIQGLRSPESRNISEEASEKIDYKVLTAYKKVKAMADVLRNPTFATRFNSISSAVGPLIIDNLITQRKIDQFTYNISEQDTHLYRIDGNEADLIDITDIFDMHPVLEAFSQTMDVANNLFRDMPAGSIGFRNLLATLSNEDVYGDMANTIYRDKKLLDQLSNFYQSYLLVASGMVNPDNLKYYIEEFPVEFIRDIKDKYPDNELIQSIRMGISKETQKPYLQIQITGIDEQRKEELRNAWIDLHKQNPELSQKLFNYSFFRAGVGFSPKTFMALVPTYVKERLSVDLGNGEKASYLDTYRKFPSVVEDLVIDQFVRNNWNNNKLIPPKDLKDHKYNIDTKRGVLLVRDAADMADLAGVKYMKTKSGKQTLLWKASYSDKYVMEYKLIKPLGNNGEYFEISLDNLNSPMTDTVQDITDTQESTDIKEQSSAEEFAEQPSKESPINETQKEIRATKMGDMIMGALGYSRDKAEGIVENAKQKPKQFAKFLQNVFRANGIQLNEEETLKEFNKFC